MKRSSGRILTTHVGSLPRPQDLAGMIMSGAQTGTPEQRAAFDARVASAVNEVVDKQIAAGVDIVSDGEQGKIMSGAQTGTPGQRGGVDARGASAVNEVVDKQIDAGGEIVRDGEQGKIGFVNYVKDRLDGFNGKATPFMAADLMEFQSLGAG